MRPSFAPDLLALGSENAAHRIAVVWDEGSMQKEGVYIPRRDTDSVLTSTLGGMLFPGNYHRANFSVDDNGGRIEMKVLSTDGEISIDVAGTAAEEMPAGSVFSTLADASIFFEAGSCGYSEAADGGRLEGMELRVREWSVRPFAVDRLGSSYFANRSIFPEGAIDFDHALIMSDVEHEWLGLENMETDLWE